MVMKICTSCGWEKSKDDYYEGKSQPCRDCWRSEMRVKMKRNYREANGLPMDESDRRHKGDDVGYRGAHKRVYKENGVAAAYPCAHCGQQADHWAYSHNDPNEKAEFINGAYLKYSVSPEFYIPLCATDHKRFDKLHR